MTAQFKHDEFVRVLPEKDKVHNNHPASKMSKRMRDDIFLGNTDRYGTIDRIFVGVNNEIRYYVRLHPSGVSVSLPEEAVERASEMAKVIYGN